MLRPFVAVVPFGDPPPLSVGQAAGCSVLAAFEGGRRAGHDGIQPDARASGRVGQGCGLRRAGGNRDGRAGSQEADLLGLRSPRPENLGSSRHALAAYRRRRRALPGRMSAQTAVSARAAGTCRRGRVGARRRAVHARLRRSHGVAVPADESDAGPPADADRLGDNRQDPRAARLREAVRPAGWTGSG